MNREEWLGKAAGILAEGVFKRAGETDVPPMRISVGWPSKSPLGKKTRRMGECWDKAAASDHQPHIFISPLIAEVVEGDFSILAVLAHEMVHGVIGCKHGHKAPFKKLAKAVGLEGPAKSSTAGARLTEEFRAIVAKLGAYPAGSLTPAEKEEGEKKQTTRMIKCECETCGYTARTTAKWLENSGAPICPCNREPMFYQRPDEGGEGEDEGGED